MATTHEEEPTQVDLPLPDRTEDDTTWPCPPSYATSSSPLSGDDVVLHVAKAPPIPSELVAFDEEGGLDEFD